ncbi:MAG: L-threonylcarbamoyladenylate synthase [Chthonomonadales bacterium]
MTLLPVKTEVLRVDAADPQPEAIERAAAVIREGGLVAFPTETVYGLGADATRPDAVAAIYAAKGRPPTNPIIVHVASVEEAQQVAAQWPQVASRLAQRFWPGPLTLVVWRSPRVPAIVAGGGDTVAVRAPAHPVAQALIQASGVPIAAPSANRSSRVSPTRAEHVLKHLEGRIHLVLDGGPTPGGIESTVLDVTCVPPRLLRPGPIPPRDLQKIAGTVELHAPLRTAGPMPSPGMLPRHYAPSVPLELAAGSGRQRVEDLVSRGIRTGWLPFHPSNPVPGAVTIPMPRNPGDYASLLYATLHTLEDAGVQIIVAAMPPNREEWLGVRDRLLRAAAPQEEGGP